MPPVAEGAGSEQVSGERSQTVVNSARSVQSRVSSVLAAGLMIVLGVATLTWYYAHVLTRRSQGRTAAQSSAVSRAQGEMPLPPLGHITPPALHSATIAGAIAVPAEIPLPESPTPAAGAATASANMIAPPRAPETPPNPAGLRRARELSGGVFSRASESQLVGQSTTGAAGTGGTRTETDESVTDAPRGAGALATLLRATVTAPVPAQLLPSARLLLPKGAFIDCTLETAIDSTLPGMTTCITAADTFSADGKVVLLERGTKLVGETRGQVLQGQARLFVLWTEARTPQGVVVPLDSPGTDELGRAGLSGEVQHHFWQRFGAAILVSIIDGAVQAGVQASNRSGGTVIYAPSASQDVLTEVLKDTVSIAPTITKRNGERIQVLVARDLDFRPVYELRASATGP